ncbi:MAG TPA: hypothetical protein VMW87_10740 [Spirochaetia bacterium]|nr:hypothetical protein [Spirochaetia bacterium]
MKLASLKTITGDSYTGITPKRNSAGRGISRFLLAALIVTINGIQVLVTGVKMAALRNSASFSLIERDFVRLLVVGLLFVILAESLRREESAPRSADRASAEASRLNAIFAQLGQALRLSS